MQDENDIIERRRHRRHAQRRVRLLAVGVGALVVFVVVAGVLAAVGLARPSADRQGQQWTYQELRDYLATKGLRYHIDSLKGDTYLLPERFDGQGRLLAMTMAEDGVFSEGMLHLSDWKTPEQARQAAGRVQSGRYAWGRFVFTGKSDELAKLKVALP